MHILVQLCRNVMPRNLEMVINMNFMKYCNNGSPSEVQHVPKMTKNRVLRVNFDLDGEPLSHYFIKFMLRIISRLLDFTFSAKLNKDMH